MTGYGLALDYQGRYYAADNARRTAEATLDRVRALEAYLANEARHAAEQMYATGSYDPQAAGRWSAYDDARACLGDALRGTP